MKPLSLLAAAAVLWLLPASAWAGPGAPYCQRVNGGVYIGAYDNCSFASFEQCRLSIIGIGGFCVRNPYYAVREPAPARKPRRDRR